MLRSGNTSSTRMRGTVSRGLVIEQPWVSLILDGKKTWEMRTRPTRVRGWIGLIEKGSDTIIGVAYLKDSLSALERSKHRLHYRRHRIPLEPGQKVYKGKNLFPWVWVPRTFPWLT